ncbi:MAG: Dot/Icm secretion system protein IcmQ [Coxiellaceae bacterium]|nr:Dot/Icm secretion system protein IcmQ [Coxiellaceae bacterium]
MEALQLNENQRMDNDQLNSQLLELIEAEKAAFKKILDEFYANSDHSTEKFCEVNDRLIASLNRIFKIYEDNNGKQSLFLTNTLKPLRQAYERAEKYKDAAEGRLEQEEEHFDGVTVPEDREVVHISLYMARGHEIANWQHQMVSLGKLIQSRPVYRTEAAVQKAIRAKMSLSTEGYVSVAVKKTAIINTGNARLDRQGNELVTLAEGAIDNDKYILQFVLAGKYYRYLNEKLVLTVPGKGGLFR